jgi:hypothetical protein
VILIGWSARSLRTGMPGATNGMTKVYLDSCLAIYLVERHPRFYAALHERIAVHADATFCVSALTRLEVLTRPLREGDPECRHLARDTCRGLLPPTGLAQWRQPVFSRGRPAVTAALHTAERHSAHNDLTACRVRFAYGLRLLRDLRPLRHSGHTHAPTPTADYPPRASHFPGGQRRRLRGAMRHSWGHTSCW